MEQAEELLTASDVAGLFKISPETIYSWRYQGKIPYIKINGAVRFKRTDITKMIEDGHRISGTKERDKRESREEM